MLCVKVEWNLERIGAIAFLLYRMLYFDCVSFFGVDLLMHVVECFSNQSCVKLSIISTTTKRAAVAFCIMAAPVTRSTEALRQYLSEPDEKHKERFMEKVSMKSTDELLAMVRATQEKEAEIERSIRQRREETSKAAVRSTVGKPPHEGRGSNHANSCASSLVECTARRAAPGGGGRRQPGSR